MSERIHIVHWHDSQSVNGWHTIEELSAELDRTTTVGFLAHESEAYIVIAHSYDPQTESYNGAITIPRSAIDSMRVLGRVKV